MTNFPPNFAREDLGARRKIKPITTTFRINNLAQRAYQVLGNEVSGIHPLLLPY
jgi:hypothetical protein